MKALTAALLTSIIVVVMGGCTGPKMKEPMDSGKTSMEKPMEKTMKDETMMKDTATEPMKPKMDSMDKPAQ